MLDIVAVRLGCGYFYISWTVNNSKEICKVQSFIVKLSTRGFKYDLATDKTFNNFTNLPGDTVFNVTVFGTNKANNKAEDAATTVEYTSVKTVAVRGM